MDCGGQCRLMRCPNRVKEIVTTSAATCDMPQWTLRKVRALALAILLIWSVGLAACSSPVASTSEVADLAGVNQLAEAFNDVGSDTPKLILLLSPT